MSPPFGWFSFPCAPVTEQALSGGVAEWLKAAVLKTARRESRGFESLLLRQIWNRPLRGTDVENPGYGEMAEWLKALPC